MFLPNLLKEDGCRIICTPNVAVEESKVVFILVDSSTLIKLQITELYEVEKPNKTFPASFGIYARNTVGTETFILKTINFQTTSS